jgi:hypothetical protein
MWGDIDTNIESNVDSQTVTTIDNNTGEVTTTTSGGGAGTTTTTEVVLSCWNLPIPVTLTP